MDFTFDNFVHKDFNINNLLYLPSRKRHLKCGIVDYQNAFWGECCWDLFSLLEDSRIDFSNKFNNYYINMYYQHTKQKISLEEFKIKYNFLNCSRQTRLLGRWVKLSKELNKKKYLDFIDVTKKKLFYGLREIENNELRFFYTELMPEFRNA